MKNKITMSSRSVGMRDINATLSAPISRIKTLRDDEGRKGFTLIELLVVVLIIGILAAVALPQYQFVIDKSRVAPHILQAKEIVKAEHLYYLANGTYTGNLKNLDIDMTKTCPTYNNDNQLTSCTGGFGYNLGRNPGRIFNGHIHVTYCGQTPCTNSSDSAIFVFTIRSADGKLTACTNNSNTARGQRLCKYVRAFFQ